MDNIIQQTKAIFTIKDINRDNLVFKLFTQLSVGLCLLATVLVGASQYFGQPIICSHQTEINGDLIEAYCWIHGSRHVQGILQDSSNCISVIDSPGDEHENKFTIYYQWVVFMLGLNALIFRIPHLVWKIGEGELLKQFCSKEAKNSLVIGNESTLQSLLHDYTKYFDKIKGHLRSYYIIFIVCQLLNLAMVSLNMFVNDKFLFGTFMSYGLNVLNYFNKPPETNAVNPMCNAFPTMVSCNIKTAGLSNQVQNANGLCILSQNIINEKIYLILWFWFVFLFVVGSMQVLLELLFLTIPSFRNYMIRWQLGTYLTSDMKGYLNSCCIGDWFFLCQIGKNSNKHFFYQFLENLATNHKKSASGNGAEKQPLISDDLENEEHELKTLK